MNSDKIWAKKDEATEIAPNLMFSQRNNPYCELLHILCCKNRYFSNTASVFLKKIVILTIYLGIDKYLTNEENIRT